MKKLMLGLAMAFAANVAMAAVKIGDLWYDLNTDAKTASVIKDQDFPFQHPYPYPSLENAVIPSQVQYDGETYIVTSIGDSAFWNCSGLTSVTIPSSVTSIGDSAFQGCSGLTSVTIPSGVTSIGDSVFRGCSGLTGELTIPSGVTSIGNSAFMSCSGLTSVTIPSSVTSIGDFAFSGCSSLAKLYIDSIESWCGISFGDILSNPFNSSLAEKTLVVDGQPTTVLVIPAGVTAIPAYAFQNLSMITSVTIPEGVTSIGDSAFYGCSGLTRVEIPSSVTSIGASAFQECSGLTGELTIPSGVTSIGDSAFYGCSGLTSVTIPSSVESISGWAFFNCSSLKQATVLAADPPTGGSKMFNGTANGFVILVPEESVTDYKDAPDWSAYEDKIQGGWIVGDKVLAYMSGTTLGIVGLGAMSNFTSAASLPWVADANKVTAVTIGEGVTLGKNALAGLSDDVLVSLPASTSSIGSMKGTMGASEPVIPDDKVLVAKEELQAAKAETVTVADGVVSLGVTVKTNGNFTAETKDWQPVELTSDNVEVKDGKIVISIPVAAQQGFMILQSGDAKIKD